MHQLDPTHIDFSNRTMGKPLFSIPPEDSTFVADLSKVAPKASTWTSVFGGKDPAKTLDLQVPIHAIKVVIDTQRLPHGLLLSPKDPLVELELAPQPGVWAASHEAYVIRQEKTRFNLRFNPAAVLGYAGGAATVNIYLEVQMWLTEAKKAKVFAFTLPLKLSPAAQRLSLSFEKSVPNLKAIPYEDNAQFQVGILKVLSVGQPALTPKVDVLLRIECDHTLRDVMQLDAAAIVGSSNLPKIRLVDKDIQIEGLEGGSMLAIPFRINLGQLGRPLRGSSEYQLVFCCEYGEAGNTQVERETLKFSIDLHTEAPALMVCMNDEELIEITSQRQEPLELKKEIFWSKEDSGMVRCYQLLLSNTARAGIGSIYITDLRVHFQAPEIVPKDYVQGRGFQAIKLMVNERDAPAELFFEIANGSKPISISHVLVHRFVDRLLTDAVECTVTFTFDCIISKMSGLSKERALVMADARQTWQFVAKLEVRPNLGMEWLALDFGTSAIVAAYDDLKMKKRVVALSSNGVGSHINLLQLQKINAGLINEGYHPENIQEYGTSFLSSEIFLRSRGIIGSLNRETSLVSLSPTTTQKLAYSNQVLPFLKSLIGYENLAEINSKLNELQYCLVEDGEVFDFRKRPLSSEDILKITYRNLLHHYIVPAIGDQANPPNKLVITLPNTFSLNQVQEVRESIAVVFPDVVPENIHFLSESDAVAAYYMHYHHVLNLNRAGGAPNARPISDLRDAVEYVMVYDMGAGTLDVTYLAITRRQGQIISVEILGRLGRTSAGNFLDFLLAEGIVKSNRSVFLEQEGFMNGTNPKGIPDDEQLASRKMAIKKFVREYVKPRLSDWEGSIMISEVPTEMKKWGRAGQEQNLTLGPAWRDALEFYFELNTFEVFKVFFELFPMIDGKRMEKGQFPLDTLVVTGRGSNIPDLRDRLKLAVAEWVGEGTFYMTKPEEESGLKSAVVEGAIFHAITFFTDSRRRPKLINQRLQAEYGVLWGSERSGFQYKRLLHPSANPTYAIPQAGSQEVKYVYESEPQTIDFSQAIQGFVVQTTSLQTEREFNGRYLDNIAKLYEFGREDVTNALGAIGDITQFPISVTVELGRMIVVSLNKGAMIEEVQAAFKTDIADNETLKKSLWPFID